MAGGKPIKISILANAQKAIAETNKLKGALGDLGNATGASKLKNGMANVARGVAVGAGALIAGVGVLAVSTAKDLMRVERLGAATENAIKATGGAAGRSKGQVDAMAQQLERLTGAEAESVTEGQNMLLTFKNIRGDQFDAATKAALDMGVAMNKGSLQGLDLSKTSIQLGKALNDPVKGISALSKVGVSFNAQQKEQIKRMTEAGDVAGAQGVILKELQGEFGGAAAAAGKTTEGMIAKVQNSFGNIAEEVFAFILPLIAKVGEWIQTKALPALQKFGDWMKSDGVGYVKAFADGFKANVLPALQALGAFITGTVIPAIVNLGTWIVKNRDWLSAIVVTIGTAVAIWKTFVVTMAIVRGAIAAAAAIQAVWNIAMAANPIGIIIVAVAALVAGLVYFFTQTKTGKAIVENVWKAIQTAINAVVSWWQNTALPIIQAVWTSITTAFQQGKDAVGRFMNAAWEIIKKVWSFTPLGLIVNNWGKIMAFFRAIPGKVKAFFTQAWNFIKAIWSYSPLGLIVNNWSRIMAFFRGIPGKVQGVFNNAIGWLIRAGSSILRGLGNGIRNGWSAVSSYVSGLKSRISGYFSNAGSILYNAGSSIINGFLNGLRAAWGNVTSFVSGIAGWIRDNKGPISYDRRLLIPAGQAIMDSLRSGLEDGISPLKRTLDKVTGVITGTDLGTLSTTVNVASGKLNSALAVERQGVAGSNSGAGLNVIVEFEKTGDPLIDTLIEMLRKRVRVGGNNPQAFFQG